MYILSVDFGTSSVKISILDKSNSIIDSSKVEYQYKVSAGDKVELDPEVVFEGFIRGVGYLQKYLNDIEIIAYDTFSPSMVFMDERGNAIYPIITHLDRRSKKQSKDIIKVMGKGNFQKITGVLPFTGGVSITNILWMMENIPEVMKNTFKMGHLNTYIYKRMTGVWATDPTNASMMGLYETISWGGWSEEICSIFNIPKSKLPDIHTAGTVLGSLCAEVARLTGLRSGIPVVLGSNDAATAQIGAGNTQAGDILNISGSSEMISIISDKPVINDKYYLRNTITLGKWQVYATTVGGFAIDWFRQEFYREMDKSVFFNEYLPEVVSNQLNRSTAKFLPYLAGDRQSLIRKRGVFSGLTLDTSREDLLVAILYGTHEPIVKAIDVSRKFIDLNKTIKVTGGLIASAYMELKKKRLNGFDLEIVNDATIHGNGKLALEALKNK